VLEVSPFADHQAVPSSADRSKMPDVGRPPDAPLPPYTTATLSNGMKVVLARRTEVPVVRMTMVMDGGFSADKPDMPGVSSMAMTMLTQGTATRNATQLADQLALIAADMGAGADLDTSTVSLSVLTEKLDPALDLYADVILNPSFPDSDLARLKKNQLAQIEQEKVQPFAVALRVLPGLLYGAGHAYAQPLTGSGTEASVNAMTRADLVAYHQAWFKPNHATLVVAGDITMEQLTPKLERVFRSWKQGTVPTKNIPAVPPLKSDQIYIIDRPGADQSVVIVGQLIAPKKNPDEFAFTMFNDAFGGAFGSRVNMNLREDKHWSYGAGSQAMDARGQRMWVIFAPVQTDKTRESVVEVIKELKAVVDDKPLSAGEVQEAKDRQTLTLAGRWETTGAIRSALQEIVTYDLPADYYTTYAQKIRAVTPAEVMASVGKLITGRKVWVIVGDRAKIEAGLKDVNLGEIRYLDGDGRIRK
jgi:zinc protease